MKWKGRRLLAMALTGILLAGCGAAGQVDDYATNEGSTQEASTKTTGTESGGISKDKIKVGVLHLSDPAEGSGYTYTHDLGIQAMQQNLGLSDEQIDRKINVDDSDKEATEKAIQECVDDGCNIILPPAGDIWMPRRRWRKNIRIYILHMEPDTKATGRIL